MIKFMRIIFAILIALTAASGWILHSEFTEQKISPPPVPTSIPEPLTLPESEPIDEAPPEPKKLQHEVIQTPLRKQDLDTAPIPDVAKSEPPPLRAEPTPNAVPQTLLTLSGVLQETNAARNAAGFSPLFTNDQLHTAARIKVEDMFARQYFEHVSPTGDRPADLATRAGYEFILVGENLALGNFGDDTKLVQAWMDSPGHRANILNAGYTEIGIAVAQGIFNGRTTWLAAQEFGRPITVCPRVDPGLHDRITVHQTEITRIRSILDPQLADINAPEAEQTPGYADRVARYNALVEPHNTLVDELKTMIAAYNQQVTAFNACVS